ncbi:MAG: hypothetical protein ACP5H7_03025, partial [Minisyncoccia bacterium]
LFLGALIKKQNFIYLFMIFIFILVNIPENLDILKGFNPLKPGSYISQNELEALNFLKKKEDGVILTITNFEDTLHKESAYVSALTGKQTYFNDLHVLNITGIDYKKRQEEMSNLELINWEKIPIQYIYILKSDNNFLKVLKKLKKLSNYKIVFENTEITIIEKMK